MGDIASTLSWQPDVRGSAFGRWPVEHQFAGMKNALAKPSSRHRIIWDGEQVHCVAAAGHGDFPASVRVVRMADWVLDEQSDWWCRETLKSCQHYAHNFANFTDGLRVECLELLRFH